MNIIRHINHRFPIRFHNRLMVYNTLIFLTITYVLAFFATRYSVQVDMLKQLQQSRDALSAICNYYDRKHDQFINLIFPLYVNSDNYDILSRLLESPSDQEYEIDPFHKQEIVNLMQSITIRDSEIAAIFIHKNLTDQRYVYDSESRTLETVGADYPFFAELGKKKLGRSIFGSRNISIGSGAPVAVHGIAGTIGSKNIRTEAGQILIAYKTEAIDRIFQTYAGKTQGQFLILTKDGEVIFDSDGHYGNGKTLPTEALLSGKSPQIIDGKPYYIQTIISQNRNYFGVNLVPKALIDKKNENLPYVIYGAVTAVAVLCAIFYSIAGSLVSQRLVQIITAMKRIGSNNLSYRIPIVGRMDEFGELAARFNEMCDELQDTINREYLTELKQKNAELNALQATINPHFLYNTLEAIRVKAHDDGNAEVSEMIVLLAALYRGIVRDDTFIPIRKELSMCEMYMSIFSLRYSELFEYSIEVDPRLTEYGIPKNLLQPVIENYFVHGLRNLNDDNQFTVRGVLRDCEIEFIFEDNGRGMSKERLQEMKVNLQMKEPQSKSSYGLLNVQERIRLVYGDNYGISLFSEENSSTRIIVRFGALTCKELEARIHSNKMESAGA